MARPRASGAAAGAARGRLQARLGLELDPREESETEMQYCLPGAWSVRMFVALCRKHGIRPYRYPRKRCTTVMVRVRQSGCEETVGEELRMLHRELTANFSEMVDHLIADALKSDGDDETHDQHRLSG